MAANPQFKEERLDALREEAARTGKVQDHGVAPVGSPFPKPASGVSYHGNPVLKPPTWTWQVPLYFFVGGVAGISAVIALAAHLFGDAGLLRAGLWIGFLGALISAPLLIADLGRPARFLNMLRVFKWRSAMSVGAWTLAKFSSAVGLAVVCHELILAGYGNGFLLVLEWLAEISAALSGLILASYTSVLLGVTAIPVWSENRRLVPVVFLGGGLGSAAAVLELLGFLVPVTQFIGIVASTVETLVAIIIELRGRYVDRPLREGAIGWLTRAGAALAGPISFLLRIFLGHSSAARYLAAVCFIIGALISRYAWIGAGRVSSRDPQALFRIQRPGPNASAH
ncbi:MAG: NrfD/PsrC family molybdoenzyme membrane anchor subunit [Terriglobales bacterium]